VQDDQEVEMPKRKDVVADELRQLADDLEELWKAITRDPAVEQRKRRGWAILTGVLGAAATMGTRRVLGKLWPILTGERPPVGPAPSGSPRKSPSARREEVAKEDVTS
jgi:hypothetical protein